MIGGGILPPWRGRPFLAEFLSVHCCSQQMWELNPSSYAFAVFPNDRTASSSLLNVANTVTSFVTCRSCPTLSVNCDSLTSPPAECAEVYRPTRVPSPPLSI